MRNPPLLSPLIPRQAVPPLQVPTLIHGSFTLSGDAAANFSLLVFYRGLHCPICFKYLLELGRLQAEFGKRGVKVVAISSDGRERAQAMADKLKAPDLRVGYDLNLAKAREWGLYISTSRGTTCSDAAVARGDGRGRVDPVGHAARRLARQRQGPEGAAGSGTQQARWSARVQLPHWLTRRNGTHCPWRRVWRSSALCGRPQAGRAQPGQKGLAPRQPRRAQHAQTAPMYSPRAG
jgi:peroxiredoxin